jgi:two-component system CheB/CheR fusion protein
MGVTDTEDLAAYLEFVKTHTGEAEALANDLMINVTGFFRDPQA